MASTNEWKLYGKWSSSTSLAQVSEWFTTCAKTAAKRQKNSHNKSYLRDHHAVYVRLYDHDF
eukprot:3616605-Amphidinium_carterae.1